MEQVFDFILESIFLVVFPETEQTLADTIKAFCGTFILLILLIAFVKLFDKVVEYIRNRSAQIQKRKKQKSQK